MSINLSNELIGDLQDAVLKQVPNADTGVVLQHLAAVIGFALGHEPISKQDKDAFLAELSAFAAHICSDIHSKTQEQPATPPAGDAFGIWEPK